MKKLRSTWIAAIVLVALSLPVSATEAAGSGLPCYDMWRGCLDGGGSAAYCEGVWLGCMNKTYGSLQ